MEKFIVDGEVQLLGSVKASGAKNATLPIMAASLLCSGVTVLRNVPCLRDVEVMREILSWLGAASKWDGDTLLIDTTNVARSEVPEHLMREMRASVFLMGPLVGRFQKVKLSYPGGCSIGSRPINLHLKALRKIGAQIKDSYGCIEAKSERLRGAEIVFDFPSVGATENAIMASVLADGITVIRNAAREPEISDLQNFLNKMGASVSGAGSDTIVVRGVASLTPSEHEILPDRIEAGTFLLAGAITGGDVTVEKVNPEHLSALIDKLQEAGALIDVGSDRVRIRASELRGVDVKTLPYPGFPTDLQAPMLSLLSICKGTSIVTETIFENRFKHVGELIRMGARIKVEGRTAIAMGVPSLSGARVAASDLRAGAALVLAALAAEGRSEIEHVEHIDRGYERLELKLQNLGARILREKTA